MDHAENLKDALEKRLQTTWSARTGMQRAHCVLAAAGLQEVDVELDDAVSGAPIMKRSPFFSITRSAPWQVHALIERLGVLRAGMREMRC